MTVELKELKERVLPPVDDDLARTGSEFDTLAELRADIEGRLLEQVQEDIDARFRAAAVDELVRASNVVATGPLVEARTQELLAGLVRSLQARGIDAGTYLQVTGVTPEDLEARLRAEATQSVARELVLDAVADQLGLEVDDDEIRSDLRQAGETDEDIEEFMAQYAQSGLKGQIPLYTAFMIDALSLPKIGELALGIATAGHWAIDLPNAANEKFVSGFRAAYKRDPSFYAAQGYDAANFINSAVVGVKGNLADKDGLARQWKKPTTPRCAALTATATITFRFRISICRKR